MIGLFIGRFQPFHMGHLDAVKQILKECDTIIIGVGSSQYEKTNDNPFSYEQRKQIIQKTLNNNKIKNFKIIAIPDIHNPPLWVDHVNKTINEKYDIAYSGNPITIKLFKEKNIKTKKLIQNIQISATKLRKIIRN